MGASGVRRFSRTGGVQRLTLTDTDGRLLAVEVHAADVQDRDGAKGVLKRSRRRFPFVEHVFADGGYAGKLVKWTKDKTHIALGIVRRAPWMQGFVIIRRRWVVERTFAWIMEVPPPRPGLRANPPHGRNPDHHRRHCDPHQEIAVTLLKHWDNRGSESPCADGSLALKEVAVPR